MRYESGNEIPDHPAMCAHPGAEGLLWIEGRAGPCLLFLTTCGEPTCPCREVLLHLQEVTAEGAHVEEALEMQAWFDADTGAIVSPADLPPPHQALLEEAAAALPPGTLRTVLAERDAASGIEKNLAAADIPVEDVRQGVLQSWLQHATGGRDMASGGTAIAGRIDRAGRAWFLDVLYCPNPDCDCRKIHVVGMALELPEEKAHPGPAIVRDHFIVTVPFRGSRLTIFECDPGYEETALAVVGAWLARDPGMRATFERQYAEVRAIGARCLRQAGWSPRQVEAPRRKVGRNEACPCGSGKKYKQCCERG